MKKTLYVIISIIVISAIWFGFNYFKSKNNDSEIKRVFQEYITTNYSEAELPGQNDIMTVVALKNPGLFANLVFKAVTGPNRISIPSNKVNILVYTVGYSSESGRNEKVFDRLLQTVVKLIQLDPQNFENKRRYFEAITTYFNNSTGPCASGLGDLRTKSMLERCVEQNNPFVLVYNTLGKYGDEIDNELLTFTKGPELGRSHFWALYLRQKYGSNITTEILKNDPIIEKLGGEIPDGLKKELGI